jgi:hypothetical protein
MIWLLWVLEIPCCFYAKETSLRRHPAEASTQNFVVLGVLSLQLFHLLSPDGPAAEQVVTDPWKKAMSGPP